MRTTTKMDGKHSKSAVVMFLCKWLKTFIECCDKKR